MDSIHLQGLTFWGYHGCFAEEKTNGQPFYVDVTLYLSLEQAGKNDTLSETVDYGTVYTVIKEIVTEKSFGLIEAVAEDIAQTLLSTFAILKKVGVTVHKPQAPIGGLVQDVNVSIERAVNE